MVLNSVNELLECPVCAILMSPPIHQCPNGHTLCSICKGIVQNRCPMCRSDMGNIRCLALEKIAELFEPSDNNYDCPYVGFKCSVTGNITQLLDHLKNDHNVDMHDGFQFNHLYVQLRSHEMQNATWMPQVFNCHGRNFCLHFEVFLLGITPCYIAFLWFMGEATDAEKFRYTLKIGGDVTRVIWQGVPRSIRDSHLKVRDSLDGLVIPYNLALLLSEGNEQELQLRVEGCIRIETPIYTQIHKNIKASVVKVASHGLAGKPLSDTKLLEKGAELPYNCPCVGSGCSVTDNISKLVTHLRCDHNVGIYSISTYFDHLYIISNPHEVKNGVWMLSVFKCFDQELCLQLEAFYLGTTPFYILFLWFMGEDIEAKKFRYIFEVATTGRKRILTWRGVPRSIHDNHQKVRDGLVIPGELAISLSDGNDQELKLLVFGRDFFV